MNPETLIRSGLKMQKSGIERLFRAAGYVFLWAVCLLLLWACNGSGRNAEKPAGEFDNTLRYDVNFHIDTLDPLNNVTGGATYIFPLLYSYLFVPDENGTLMPDLATEWRYDTDDLTWTIWLRPDASFHNGNAVTARDVKYSLERYLAAYPRDLKGIIDRLDPVSDKIVRIHLKKEAADLPGKIWDFEIFPEPGDEKIDWVNRPVGSGPFMFQTREGQDRIFLSANPDYYGGRPAIDRMIFYYVPRKEKSWTRLLRGETDIIPEITPRNYRIMDNIADKFYFNRYLLRHYTILLYNTHDPLFEDVRVRRALTHAIDREYIVEHILNGYGEVAHGPMGVGSPFHNPEVVPLAYDPKKSLDLFRSSGWLINEKDGLLYHDGRRFEFTINYMKGYGVEESVVRYIQLCFGEVGIKTYLEPIPDLKLMNKYHIGKAFQAILTEFTGIYNNPEKLSGLWGSSPVESAEGYIFDHPEVSALSTKALFQKDPEQQKVIFHRIDALIADLQPVTFLFHKTAIDVMSRRVKLPSSFSLTYEGIYRLQHAAILRK